MHSAKALRERYANGSSTPGEVNAIARIYASIKKLSFPQALEEVHDGLGYGMAEDIDCSQGGFPWLEVERSLVPSGRRWINGLESSVAMSGESR